MSILKKWNFLGAKRLGTWFGALFFSVVILAAVCVASNNTDLPAELQVDPMNGAWKSRILPHHRLLVSYRDNNFNIKTFVGSKEDDTGKLSVFYPTAGNEEHVRMAKEYGAGDSNNYIFASSVAEGTAPVKTVTLSADQAFYGVTTFTGVPQNVLVTSYLVRHNGGTNSIWLDMWADGKNLGLYHLPEHLYSPVYQFKYNRDGKMGDAPALDQNTAHDLVASDWNGDGYTDYALTYVKNKDKPLVKILLVDGKSLYNYMSTGSGDVITTEVNGSESSILATGSSVVGGASGVTPANSIRMTKGDFDGDGRDEIAIYYTLIHGAGANQSRANQLEIYRVNYDTTKGYQGKCVYNTQNMADGSSFLQHNSVGLAAGDINGDGSDELVYIHADSPSVTDKDSYVYMSICSLKKNNTLVRYVDRSFLCKLDFYLANTTAWSSVPSIEVKIADFDGDSLGELVWSTGTGDGGTDLKLWVHDWDITQGGTIADTGKNYVYSATKLGWWLNKLHKHHSLATGLFSYPTNGSLVRHQIALAHMGNGENGTANMDFGILSWSKDKGLLSQVHTSYNNVQMDGNMGASVAAVDLYGESLVLGSPSVLTVEDNIELSMVTQAPPKHWDKVSAADSELLPLADANGDVTLDAFALFQTQDYYTAMALNGSFGQASTTTKVSEGNFGLEGSYALEHREGLLKKAFANNKAQDDPLLDLGIQYSRNEVHNQTKNYASSLSFEIKYKADRDDQIYYKSNSYNLCRYPILLPESKRYSTTSDDKTGEIVSLQNYVQYVVPTMTASVFTPTPGRKISWYEPLHDTYNLFTYPKRLTDITGYPEGEEAKLEADKYDPWADINGKVFVSGQNNLIGNSDASEFTMKASVSGSTQDYNSIRQTAGGHVYFHPTFGHNDRQHLNVDLTGDYSWGTDSTTTADASKMLNVTMSWPGAVNYTQHTKDWSASDMQFYVDAAYFTQDDGAICVGYAVPKLKQAGSKIWGPSSPYATHPDPGLMLPFRWNNDIKNGGASGQPDSKGNYLQENQDKYTSNQMRGITFTKSDSTESAVTATTGDGLSPKLLEKGKDYKVKLRVINYSFVTAVGVTVKFYFQPWSNESGARNYPSTDPARDGYKPFDSKTLGVILGRTTNFDTGENWVNTEATFHAPGIEGLGWVHAVVEYNDKELSTKNNHGWVLVGAYDPALFKGGAADNSVSSGSAAAQASLPAAERPTIRVKEVKVYEIKRDASGDISYEETKLDEKARYKQLRVDATVGFSGGKIIRGGKERQIAYVPALRCALFAGKGKDSAAILGAADRPVMKEGHDYTFSFVYDPSQCPTDSGVTVRAFSPYLSRSEQGDSTSQSQELWRPLDSSGGSGCNAGFAVLSLLALLPLMLKKKK